MKKNNRGFTLVELLIAVAIFSLVFASASSIMIFTSKSFAKANADAGIQREAQLVVNQIGDMIIDSTGDIDFVDGTDSKELIMYNQQNDGSYLKESVLWSKSDNTIKYSKYQASYDSVNDRFDIGSTIASNELLAEDVKGFDVDLSDVRREYDEKGRVKLIVKSVKVSAEYEDEKGKVSYATTPVITLRNRMLMVGSAKDVEPPVVYELNVRVNLAGVSEYVDDDNKTNLRLRCVSTVIQTGFDNDEITYQWSVKEPWVQMDSAYVNNPKECYFYISEKARKDHLGDIVTMTLTATPPPEKHAQVKDSDTYMVSKYGGEERGEIDRREDYFIPGYVWDRVETHYYAGYNLKVNILDERGDILPHSDYLINNNLLTVYAGGIRPNNEEDSKMEFANFHCLKSAYLDYSKSYIVEMKYQVHLNPAPQMPTDPWHTTRFYVPATRIISENPVCIWDASSWSGFRTVFMGHEATGDAIKFRTDGFLKETWRDYSPYKLSLKDYNLRLKDENCGLNMEDYEIRLNPNISQKSITLGSVAKDNRYYIPFQLEVVEKETGKVIGSNYKNDIYTLLNKNVIMQNITVTMTLDPEKLEQQDDITDIKPDKIPTVSQDIKVRFVNQEEQVS